MRPLCITSNEGVVAMPPLRTLAQAMFERRAALLQEAEALADQARRSAALKAEPES